MLSDPDWCARFVEELILARSVYDPDALVAQVEAWDAQISSALQDDPHRTFSFAQHEAAINHLTAFLSDRADFVDDWLAEGGHCPPTW